MPRAFIVRTPILPTVSCIVIGLLSGCDGTLDGGPAERDATPDATTPNELVGDAAGLTADAPARLEIGTAEGGPAGDSAVDGLAPAADSNAGPHTDAWMPKPCTGFTAQKAGNVASAAIKEASGVVVSRQDSSVLWTHGDSGQSNHIFAIRPDGTLLGDYELVGTKNQDWEDIAVGPGPKTGVHYLYVGDIGNNGGGREVLTIYRLEEPAVDPNQPKTGVQKLTGAVALTYRYEDKHYNAETLFVDPESGDIFVVTKNGSTGVSFVYHWAAPQQTATTATLPRRGKISFTGADNSFRAATGGDISPDGTEIVIRTIQELHLWQRPPGTPVWDALANPRCTAPKGSEGGGSEAIGFMANGLDLVAMTESTNSPITEYVRK